MKVGEQLVERMIDVLGNGPDVGSNSHVVVVTFPAGNNMKMEMVLDSGTGSPVALMEGASLTAIRTGAARSTDDDHTGRDRPLVDVLDPDREIGGGPVDRGGRCPIKHDDVHDSGSLVG